MDKISFYEQDTCYNLKNPKNIKHWLSEIIEKEGREIKKINIILCSNHYIDNINIKTSNNNPLKDLVVINKTKADSLLEADIYISVERVRDIAKSFSESFPSELHRTILRGLLQVMGYEENEDSSRDIHGKEEEYLDMI